MIMRYKKYILIIAFVLVAVIAFSIGKLINQVGNTQQAEGSHEKKPLYWVAPMNPNYKRDKPGKSPMGMDLVPVYETSTKPGVIRINPAVENNIGVRTDTVQMRQMNQPIKTIGDVQADDEAVSKVNSFSTGWVRDLQVKTAGEFVKKGALLFKLYSPDLVSAQEEYLLALKHQNVSLEKAGMQKLLTLGMRKADILLLKRNKKVQQNVNIYAPRSGYITKLNIKAGQNIMPMKTLMTISDLSHVWIIAEVYERDAAQLKLDTAATLHFPSFPDKTFHSKVSYIYPQINKQTRTVKVRVVLANPETQLKPGMYANITIAHKQAKPKLAIPKEALIQLGDQDRVVLALGDGQFKSTSVKIGMTSDHWVEILSGLKAGDKIVTSAQFLLDSESSLKSGLTRMDASRQGHGAHKDKKSPATPKPIHQH